jgi:hypothetical protein
VLPDSTVVNLSLVNKSAKALSFKTSIKKPVTKIKVIRDSQGNEQIQIIVEETKQRIFTPLKVQKRH